MKKIYRLCLIGILVAFVAGGTIGVCYAASNGTISQAEKQKEKLQKKKKQTEKEIAALEVEKDNAAVYIKKLDKQMNKINKEISTLNLKIESANKNLSATKEELVKAKQEEKRQYESMKLRIQYMYENGSQDYIAILLESKSFSDFLNRAEYIRKISEYDNALYEDYKEMKEKISKKEKELEDKLEELNVLNEELAYEKSTVRKLTVSKNEELKKYESSIDDANEQVNAYQEEIEKQEALIEDLLEQERKRIEEEERKRKEEEERKKQEEAKKKQEQTQQNSNTQNQGQPDSSTQTQAGGFRWPLAVSGRITSYFGGRDQPTAGASTYHKGIDIAAPQGTAVLAAKGGTVVTATYSSSAGNYVMIYHGNSTYTVYMHCSSLNVSKGQQVSQGQTIAAVGSTGVSTGAHLHFGISVGGSYVNPLNYVSQ